MTTDNYQAMIKAAQDAQAAKTASTPTTTTPPPPFDPYMPPDNYQAMIKAAQDAQAAAKAASTPTPVTPVQTSTEADYWRMIQEAQAAQKPPVAEPVTPTPPPFDPYMPPYEPYTPPVTPEQTTPVVIPSVTQPETATPITPTPQQQQEQAAVWLQDNPPPDPGVAPQQYSEWIKSNPYSTRADKAMSAIIDKFGTIEGITQEQIEAAFTPEEMRRLGMAGGAFYLPTPEGEKMVSLEEYYSVADNPDPLAALISKGYFPKGTEYISDVDAFSKEFDLNKSQVEYLKLYPYATPEMLRYVNSIVRGGSGDIVYDIAIGKVKDTNFVKSTLKNLGYSKYQIDNVVDLIKSGAIRDDGSIDTVKAFEAGVKDLSTMFHLVQPARVGGQDDVEKVLKYYPKDVVDEYKRRYGDYWRMAITTYGDFETVVITADEYQNTVNFRTMFGDTLPAGVKSFDGKANQVVLDDGTRMKAGDFVKKTINDYKQYQEQIRLSGLKSEFERDYKKDVEKVQDVYLDEKEEKQAILAELRGMGFEIEPDTKNVPYKPPTVKQGDVIKVASVGKSYDIAGALNAGISPSRLAIVFGNDIVNVYQQLNKYGGNPVIALATGSLSKDQLATVIGNERAVIAQNEANTVTDYKQYLESNIGHSQGVIQWYNASRDYSAWKAYRKAGGKLNTDQWAMADRPSTPETETPYNLSLSSLESSSLSIAIDMLGLKAPDGRGGYLQAWRAADDETKLIIAGMVKDDPYKKNAFTSMVNAYQYIEEKMPEPAKYAMLAGEIALAFVVPPIGMSLIAAKEASRVAAKAMVGEPIKGTEIATTAALIALAALTKASPVALAKVPIIGKSLGTATGAVAKTGNQIYRYSTVGRIVTRGVEAGAIGTFGVNLAVNWDEMSNVDRYLNIALMTLPLIGVAKNIKTKLTKNNADIGIKNPQKLANEQVEILNTILKSNKDFVDTRILGADAAKTQRLYDAMKIKIEQYAQKTLELRQVQKAVSDIGLAKNKVELDLITKLKARETKLKTEVNNLINPLEKTISEYNNAIIKKMRVDDVAAAKLNEIPTSVRRELDAIAEQLVFPRTTKEIVTDIQSIRSQIRAAEKEISAIKADASLTQVRAYENLVKDLNRQLVKVSEEARVRYLATGETIKVAGGSITVITRSLQNRLIEANTKLAKVKKPQQKEMAELQKAVYERDTFEAIQKLTEPIWGKASYEQVFDRLDKAFNDLLAMSMPTLGQTKQTFRIIFDMSLAVSRKDPLLLKGGMRRLEIEAGKLPTKQQQLKAGETIKQLKQGVDDLWNMWDWNAPKTKAKESLGKDAMTREKEVARIRQELEQAQVEKRLVDSFKDKAKTPDQRKLIDDKSKSLEKIIKEKQAQIKEVLVKERVETLVQEIPVRQLEGAVKASESLVVSERKLAAREAYQQAKRAQEAKAKEQAARKVEQAKRYAKTDVTPRTKSTPERTRLRGVMTTEQYERLYGREYDSVTLDARSPLVLDKSGQWVSADRRVGISPFVGDDVKELTMPEVAPAIGEQVESKLAPATRTLTEIKPATETKTGTQPVIKQETQVVTKPETETKAQVIPKTTTTTTTPVPPPKTPPPRRPVVSRKQTQSPMSQPVPAGSITWKQGMFWKYIGPKDFASGEKPQTLPRGVIPTGAKKVNLRTPQETIQVIGHSRTAKVPQTIKVDKGVVDITISGKGNRIDFTGKGQKTNVGTRIESTTTGMSIKNDGGDIITDKELRAADAVINDGVSRPQTAKSKPVQRKKKRDDWLDDLTSLKGMRY